MRRFSLHPACKLFPKLAHRELRELADDIKANGLNVDRVKEINANAPKLVDRIRSGELNVPAANKDGRARSSEGTKGFCFRGSEFPLRFGAFSA